MAKIITLTNVRCSNCGVSLAPEVDDTWGPGDSFGHKCYSCGHIETITHDTTRVVTPSTPPDVLGIALTECSAAFAGVSSHGRAMEVIEVLRSGRVTVDPLTRVRLARVMGRNG